MPFDATTLKQPWVKYGLMGVAVLGLGYIAYTHFSGGQSSGVDAAVQLAQQQNAINAQTSAQNSQRSIAQSNNDTAVQLANILSAEHISLANINSANVKASLDAATQQQAQLNSTAIQLKTIDAGVQTHVSDNNLAGLVDSNQQHASVAKNGQDTSLFGGLLGGLGGGGGGGLGGVVGGFLGGLF